MHKNHIDNIKGIFDGKIKEILPMESHASNRLYFRIVDSKDNSYIGSYSDSVETNKAFFNIGEAVLKAGINCPEIISKDKTNTYYIQTDLGNKNVFEYLAVYPDNKKVFEETMTSVIHFCVNIQHKVHKTIDYTKCYPEEHFSKNTVLYDMNSFKNNFIKAYLGDRNDVLQKDIEKLMSLFFEIPNTLYFFMHRDFQFRNIMYGENLGLIDFQSARCGPLTYDLASLLFSSACQLEEKEIRRYVDEYITYTEQNFEIKLPTEFLKYVYVTGLLRVLQALGSYGISSLKNDDKKILNSIPKALNNLELILAVLKKNYDITFPDLEKVIKEEIIFPKNIKLIPVSVTSFGYNFSDIPQFNRNHLNFFFDARVFKNPGREKLLKDRNGTDIEIRDFLENIPEFKKFVEHIKETISSVYQSSYEYSAPINKIAIYVGCTGGKHRSVYIAESIAKHISLSTKADIKIIHSTLNKKPTI